MFSSTVIFQSAQWSGSIGGHLGYTLHLHHDLFAKSVSTALFCYISGFYFSEFPAQIENMHKNMWMETHCVLKPMTLCH